MLCTYRIYFVHTEYALYIPNILLSVSGSVADTVSMFFFIALRNDHLKEGERRGGREKGREKGGREGRRRGNEGKRERESQRKGVGKE